jgi:phospholipid/cholesterol/gamma-HCH transport system substrate-binding protein
MAKVDGTMNNVNQMTQRLNATDNNVGLLLNDTTLYGNLNRTANSAAQLVEDLKAHPKRYVHFSIFGKKEKPAEQEIAK